MPYILASDNPADAQEHEMTIGVEGDGNVYDITSIVLPLVLSSNVADRFPTLIFTFDGSIIYQVTVGTAIDASSDVVVVAAVRIIENTDGLTNEYVSLPSDGSGGFRVPGGTVFTTVTSNIDQTGTAGDADQYGTGVIFGTRHKELK